MIIMKGRILAVNTGSTTTKIGFFDSGEKLFEQNLAHSLEELAKYSSVMDQDLMRRDTITDFLLSRGIPLESIDIVMARGGLVTPIRTGVYEVNQAMRDALTSGKDGVHACNLSALIAEDIAIEVNEARQKAGIEEKCRAFIADPPMADELLAEVKLAGIPDFHRRTLFHALNSRAMVRRYARSVGKSANEVTAIVAHIGGGSSVSLHRNGLVVDTTDSLGGTGPMSVERAGTVPAFQLIEMCFSGKYTKDEIKKKLVGKGGAIAYLGTNDFREILARKAAGDEMADLFVKAYCTGLAKYIGYFAPVAKGKVDVIILTGGVAYSKEVTDAVADMVSFIAPVCVYPGENELDSLAENGYGILSGEFEIRYYDPNRF